MFTSPTKREIRRFHVIVVQRRHRNVQKSVLQVQRSCFADLIQVLFCRSHCYRSRSRRRRRSCLTSVLVVVMTTTTTTTDEDARTMTTTTTTKTMMMVMMMMISYISQEHFMSIIKLFLKTAR